MTQDAESVTFNWTEADTSDADGIDYEIDFAPIGNPGGADWAYAAREGDWEILDRWIYEEATTLACGREASAEEAKQAVERWIKAHHNDGSVE